MSAKFSPRLLILGCLKIWVSKTGKIGSLLSWIKRRKTFQTSSHRRLTQESQPMVVIRLNTSWRLNSKRSWINPKGTKGKRISWGYPSKIPQGSTGASSWAERFYSRTRKRTESKVAQSPPAHPSEGNRESQKQTRRRPSTQRTRRDSWSRSKSCDKTSKSEIRSTQLRARHTTDSSNKTNCWRFRSQRNDRRGSMLSRNSIRLSHSRSSTPTLL